MLRVRGRALPDGEPLDLYADGDRWTTDPVDGAELVAEGWLLPGLVDAHTHPGAASPGDPLDEQLLRKDLRRHVASGVTMIRSPGVKVPAGRTSVDRPASQLSQCSQARDTASPKYCSRKRRRQSVISA